MAPADLPSPLVNWMCSTVRLLLGRVEDLEIRLQKTTELRRVISLYDSLDLKNEPSMKQHNTQFSWNLNAEEFKPIVVLPSPLVNLCGQWELFREPKSRCEWRCEYCCKTNEVDHTLCQEHVAQQWKLSGEPRSYDCNRCEHCCKTIEAGNTLCQDCLSYKKWSDSHCEFCNVKI